MCWLSGLRLLKRIGDAGFQEPGLSGWSDLRLSWKKRIVSAVAYKDGCSCLVQSFCTCRKLKEQLEPFGT